MNIQITMVTRAGYMKILCCNGGTAISCRIRKKGGGASEDNELVVYIPIFKEEGVFPVFPPQVDQRAMVVHKEGTGKPSNDPVTREGGGMELEFMLSKVFINKTTSFVHHITLQLWEYMKVNNRITKAWKFLPQETSRHLVQYTSVNNFP